MPGESSLCGKGDAMTYDVVVDGKTHRLELTRGESIWHCTIDGEPMEVDAALTARDVLSVLIGNKAYEIKRERSLRRRAAHIIGSARYAVDVQDPRSLRTRRAAAARQRSRSAKGKRRDAG